MRLNRGYRLGGAAIALTLGCTLFGVAYAQQDGGTEVPSNAGVVLGEVDRCGGGKETPASGISVGIQEGSTSMTKTDVNGQFVLQMGPGTYTVIATGSDGSVASRPYVPVQTGVAIDIGILDLGMGTGDCGYDTGAPAAPAAPAAATPVPPTATPEPATPVPPTATPVPPPPTDTPVPADAPSDAPQPDTSDDAG